jgi:dihydrofolate reductase
MPRNTFKAIAAMTENRVIGNKGQIPWHLPEDFKWFKRTTMGHILVMGRKTYESIGRTLPGRKTFVLSRTQRKIEGVRTIIDLSELKSLATDKTIWIAGGSEIYRQMLPLCSELFLTRVHRNVEGDTFFPEFKNSFYLADTVLKQPDFTIEHWLKKA